MPREIRRAYRGIDRKDYSVHALFALDPTEFAVGLRRSRYVRVAARGCGRETATRSWVAVLSFPRAPSAALGTAAASFFARTETGWRIWYVWYPAMGDGGFPP